ncbi:MAG: nucleoside-diphosphate sugar epimerase/dehydratase [Actinomycetota bacterium]
MQKSMAALFGTDRLRYGLLHLMDSVAWLMALGAATATRVLIAENAIDWPNLIALVATAALTTVALMQLPAFHNARSRRGSLDDAQNVLNVWLLVSPIVLAANFFVLDRPVPASAALLGLPVALVLMLGTRFTWRVIYYRLRRPNDDRPGTKRMIVFGAGEGGETIMRALLRDRDSEFVPVALLDDRRTRRSFMGIPALGTRDDIAAVAHRLQAEVLLIAIPSADSKLIAELDEIGRAAGLEVRVLPSTAEVLGMGMLNVSHIRELTEADLLGRAEVSVDMEMIGTFVNGRRVLVTGAGGSIGSELCRQLGRLDPAELFMLDRDESALHGLQLSMEGKALLDTPNLIVADIRDAERLDELFETHRFDVVFHTAALKHLTLLENHPSEGVKTNTIGSSNLIDAAIRHGVTEFVNISTDKAADPTSVLGATKLLAERLTTVAAKQTGLRYLSVRFGNVLGSRGSVLPTFRDQIAKGGPITVTHPDVTRYFMTIPEAVRLVLQAGAIGRPGEIMILDMGEPVRIVDVAQRLIDQSGKDVDIVYTGLRPGEKLHEILVGQAEIGSTREHHRITHTSGSTEVDISDEIELAEPGYSLVTECARRMSVQLEYDSRAASV